ncbi:MAG: phenylacetate--CoA ligase, partial [Synergistaceae bacterium]|nr:phenylacetate--CoA ligase [Synergistaceae bacterium]
MEMTENILADIRKNIAHAKKGEFYKKYFAGMNPEDIRNEDDFIKLPFTEKDDLRGAYPMGLCAVPQDRIVRIHSSSGTTGTPVIIPYTKRDVADWAVMFKRCYETAGVTKHDRVHITPGYGLWTAGIGFQAGAELLGAMALPMGPGNTDRQIA